MNTAQSANPAHHKNQTALWKKIRAYEIDAPTSDYCFSDRLAKENGWKLDFAIRAIEEYKKFMFLILLSPVPLTPSDAVDQVWHLHLLYTKNYWINWCRNTLEKEIHHEPTKGGGKEKMKFSNAYAGIAAIYKLHFGEEPPEDIWPGGKERFSEIDFRRVNTKRNWIIPKPF